MSRSNIRTPWPIHFKFHRVIGIDGEISILHSRVMGLYSSNCRRFFVCRAVNWEPLDQFTSNFSQLLELIVLRSVYILVKFRFFIQELWGKKVFTNINCMNVDDGCIMCSWRSCLLIYFGTDNYKHIKFYNIWQIVPFLQIYIHVVLIRRGFLPFFKYSLNFPSYLLLPTFQTEHYFCQKYFSVYMYNGHV